MRHSHYRKRIQLRHTARGLFFLATGILTLVVTLTVYRSVRAATLIVPDDYSTIQAALDAASPGDTILVRAGAYSENLAINKPIVLTAEWYDPVNPTHNMTIIDD